MPPSQHPALDVRMRALDHFGGQQQVRRTGDTQTQTASTPAADLSAKGEKLRDDMDALIDEIDEVLEENAEEFVKNYVQRGGE